MSNFDFAINHVLKSEGGYINHPNDKGGPTNLGISIAVLSEFRGKQASESDIRTLTISDASIIYKKNYWDALGLDNINNRALAYLIFDQAVNRGVSSSAKQIQSCVNAIQDGKIGKDTIAKINAFNDQKRLCIDFVRKTQIFYCKIVEKQPSQGVFILGWINRSWKLLEIVLYES